MALKGSECNKCVSKWLRLGTFAFFELVSSGGGQERRGELAPNFKLLLRAGIVFVIRHSHEAHYPRSRAIGVFSGFQVPFAILFEEFSHAICNGKVE